MSAYFKVFSTIAKKLKGNKSKVSPTIKSVPPSKRNKTFGEQKEKISKTVDKFAKGVDKETKLKMRSGTSQTLGKISKILRGEKKEGGRIGKMGGGMMGRRFGYKSGMSVKGDNKRDIRKTESMIGASKSSKREKGKTKFGMLSVKAGIDKNPNPTLADRIAGAKMKKGKA